MSEWVESPLGRLAVMRRGVGYTERTLRMRPDQGVPYLNMKSFLKDGGYNRNGLKYFAGRFAEGDVALAGDVLVANTDVTPTGDIIGVPALLPTELQMSGALYSHHVTRIRPAPGLLPQFLHFALCLQSSRSAMLRIARGTTVLMLDATALKRVLVRFPVELAAQKRIATILTSLDAAIEKTEALIEKHQQIKAGLMHDLFTRGVLPSGEMRPARSEVPAMYRQWKLGWLPSEWQCEPLGGLAQIVSGVTLGSSTGSVGTLTAPYLRVANVQDGYLDLGDVKTIRITAATLEQLRLQVGDVLMNEGGDFDKLGRGTMWAGEIEDCVHQNHVFRVRADPLRLLPQYLALHSEADYGKRYFLLSSKQSTNLASINSTQLKAYPIALPTLHEQARIVERLSAAKARLQTLLAESDKLRAQKLGLMQDLLTGNVPVKLPEPATVPA